jgi:transcriptional regulator with XRE-family HTH domain
VPRPRTEPLAAYVAANVRRRREELGQSQEEFADAALKGDLRRLQRVEAGAYDLRLSTVAALARFLEVPAASLLQPAQIPARKLGRPRKA